MVGSYYFNIHSGILDSYDVYVEEEDDEDDDDYCGFSLLLVMLLPFITLVVQDVFGMYTTLGRIPYNRQIRCIALLPPTTQASLVRLTCLFARMSCERCHN